MRPRKTPKKSSRRKVVKPKKNKVKKSPIRKQVKKSPVKKSSKRKSVKHKQSPKPKLRAASKNKSSNNQIEVKIDYTPHVSINRSPNERKVCTNFADHVSCVMQTKYFEHQQYELCGLHALNNLLQNSMIFPPPPLVTKEEIDEECKIYKTCKSTGWYSTLHLENVLKNRGYKVNELFFHTTTKKKDLMKRTLENLKNKNAVGCIILYRAPHCVNHYVSLHYKNSEYIVIDSQGSVGATVLMTEDEVEKYFFEFLSSLTVLLK